MNQIAAIVFDLDGTLYQIDGQPTGYNGSSLERAVLKNAQAFIQAQEKCSLSVAQALLRDALSDPVGISQFLAKKYQISRQEYFDQVWNIDPQPIVKNFGTAIDILNRLQTTNIYQILLTSAPRIWQFNVCKYLRLNCFAEIYTGEDFAQKKQIFTTIAAKFDPASVLAVGDQVLTDIEPARKMGMRTLQITTPNDLNKIYQIINYAK